MQNELPSDPRLEVLIEAVRRGEVVVDWAFDAIYPDRISLLSPRHWTPLEVARRAAELLVVGPMTRVLDVGSGVGKFCCVGALSTTGQFTGIEQRANLVEIATSVTLRYGIRRAEFICGDVRDLDWRRFDAFYFYNSFGENHLEPDQHIDSATELSRARFERDISFALSRLESAPLGTRVVTFYGLGAEVPDSYEPRASERIGDGLLELWVKVRA